MNLILKHHNTLHALAHKHMEAAEAFLASIRNGRFGTVNTALVRDAQSELLDYIRHQYNPTVARIVGNMRDALTLYNMDTFKHYALVRNPSLDGACNLRHADIDTIGASVHMWSNRSGVSFDSRFAAHILRDIEGEDGWYVVDLNDDDLKAWARRMVYDIRSNFDRLDKHTFRSQVAHYQRYLPGEL